MVDANTFDNGTPKRFQTRAEMYEYMVDNGYVYLDGDEAVKMHAFIKKSTKNKDNPKWNSAKAQIEANNPLLE